MSESSGNRQRDISQEERNRDLVVRFYDRFFNAHDMAAADEMLSEDYVQHNPNIATGRAAFVAFATQRFARFPQSHSTIIRSAVDNDLVYLHIHSVDQPGDCTSDYSNTLTNGKYGCYLGNAFTTAFGRFDFASGFGSFLGSPRVGSITAARWNS